MKALNYDVLFSLEPIDEFCLSSLTVNKYKGYEVLDVNKADLKLKKENDQNKSDSLDKQKMEYEILCRWLHNKFSHKVHEVRISDRLINSPALLVQGEMGMSPSMQKYMKQQATAQGISENEMFGGQSANQPVLEINPNHFIIKQLNHLIQIDKMNLQNSEIAEQIFDVASMQGGYTIDDTGLFAKRVIGMMEKNAEQYLMNVQSNISNNTLNNNTSGSEMPQNNSPNELQSEMKSTNGIDDNSNISENKINESSSNQNNIGENSIAEENNIKNIAESDVNKINLGENDVSQNTMHKQDSGLFNLDPSILNSNMLSGSDKTLL